MSELEKAMFKLLVNLTDMVYEQGDVQLEILRFLTKSSEAQPHLRESFLSHIARSESRRDQTSSLLKTVQQLASKI
jgi:hypothetical protein